MASQDAENQESGWGWLGIGNLYRQYMWVWVWLFVLTIVEVYVPEPHVFVDLFQTLGLGFVAGWLEYFNETIYIPYLGQHMAFIVVSLVLMALAKTWLVAWYYMHLISEKPAIILIACAPFVFSLFLTIGLWPWTTTFGIPWDLFVPD